MNVEIVEEFSLSDGFRNMKNAPLENAGKKEILFYKDASFRLGEFYAEELNPTSLYALREKIEFQRELRERLMSRYDIDTLALDRVLHLKVDEKKEAMMPPYVEISEEKLRLSPRECISDRERSYHAPPKVQILNIPPLIDGIHRVLLARELNLPVRCIVVRGINRRYLHCAYPNTWSEVARVGKVPEQKKFYRRREKYSFMRPLDVMRFLDKTAEKEYDRK